VGDRKNVKKLENVMENGKKVIGNDKKVIKLESG